MQSQCTHNFNYEGTIRFTSCTISQFCPELGSEATWTRYRLTNSTVKLIKSLGNAQPTGWMYVYNSSLWMQKIMCDKYLPIWTNHNVDKIMCQQHNPLTQLIALYTPCVVSLGCTRSFRFEQKKEHTHHIVVYDSRHAFQLLHRCFSESFDISKIILFCQ